MTPNFEEEKKRFSWSSLAGTLTGFHKALRGKDVTGEGRDG
jgi:hypothetical protein